MNQIKKENGVVVTGIDMAQLSDAELLRRFVRQRDELAFAQLVRRYGRLVLGVCRRVLRQEADAEDAFQATFLVLACKASSLCRPQALGSWLYRVAYRTALRARALQAQRQHQSLSDTWQEPSSSSADPDEHCMLLDQEIQRLPEKYRLPVLLCYLQGESQEVVARQLGCPVGTLKVRLWRARQLLRRRLQRRGLALGILLLSLRTGHAEVPISLEQQVSRLTSAANNSSWRSAVSSPVVCQLVESALQHLVRPRLQIALALLTSILLLVCADRLHQRAYAASPTAPAVPVQPALPTDLQPASPVPQLPEPWLIHEQETLLCQSVHPRKLGEGP